MSIRSLSVIAGALLLSAVGASESQAVPGLGVGSSYGYINATDDYQKYWGPSQAGSGDGFVIGPSGSSLHVFTNILNANIYVLTTANVASATGITFNGMQQQYTGTETFMSYSPTPYFGADLGKVNFATWTALPEKPFEPGQFYSLDVVLNYHGNISPDQWIFAAADSNGLAGLQAKTTHDWVDTNGYAGIQTESGEYWLDDNGLSDIQDHKTKVGDGKGGPVWVEADTEVEYEADTFTQFGADDASPKTTSAKPLDPEPAPVPEPGTVMLLGAGFLGLAIFGKRRRSA